MYEISDLNRVLSVYPPRDGVCMQQVREELGHVPQLVGLQAVDCLVLFHEDLLEWVDVFLVYLAKSLEQTNQWIQVEELSSPKQISLNNSYEQLVSAASKLSYHIQKSEYQASSFMKI